MLSTDGLVVVDQNVAIWERELKGHWQQGSHSHSPVQQTLGRDDTNAAQLTFSSHDKIFSRWQGETDV